MTASGSDAAPVETAKEIRVRDTTSVRMLSEQARGESDERTRCSRAFMSTQCRFLASTNNAATAYCIGKLSRRNRKSEAFLEF